MTSRSTEINKGPVVEMDVLGSGAQHRVVNREDSGVTLSSNVSCHKSMGFNPNFSDEPVYSEHKSVQREDSGYSVSSQLSLKSEKSMWFPTSFRKENIPEEMRILQKKSSKTFLQDNLTWRRDYKRILRNRCQCVYEGNEEHISPSLLNSIYTELYITDVGTHEHNNEHEIQQIEMQSKHSATWDASIQANDIFKDSGSTKQIQTVLTKGIAGIGKTVSVQKFILDWVEGRANQEVHLMFPLPFREMNGFKDRKSSLIDILQSFFNINISAEELNSSKYTIVFIFDGLDECRFPLDFQNTRSCSSVTQPVSIGVLLTNLICKNLLPSALVWITSRPAATGLLPLDVIDRVTEVRGFNDSHKEEYFNKKIQDPDLCSRIISHLKTSKVLHIMCHIPVFCWISATVLERMFRDSEDGEIPRTLTQMYTHFIMFQIKQGSHKYDQNPVSAILLLGELAFQELEKGNLLFFEDDLKEFGIEPNVASTYSGAFTHILMEEAGLLKQKVFSFVHASVQEFLAALYAFLAFVNNKQNVLSQTANRKIRTFKKVSLHGFLKFAVDKALESGNGHLDLFLRFLLGLSLQSNQALLQGLITEALSDNESNMKTIEYIKENIRDTHSAEKAISLLHCLSELKDDSLVEEVQEFIKTGGCTVGKLPPSRFSALAYILLTSAEDLDEFDLAKFIHPSMSSNEGLLRLLPVIKASRSVRLRSCCLTEKGCAGLASVLSSNLSCLKELDLGSNNLQDSGIKQLAVGLRNPQCKLETLRLLNGNISEGGCVSLASSLRSNPSHLTELDLSHNEPHDSGVKTLCNALTEMSCKLETIRLMGCELTKKSCAALAEVLQTSSTSLKHLDLSLNDLQDAGVKMLCDVLKNPSCKLEKLSLSDCKLTAEGCSALSDALKSNPSHLKELDLGINNLTDSGLRDLLSAFEDPNVHLERLWLNNCNLTHESCQMMGYANTSKHSGLKELNLSNNDLCDSGLKHLSVGLCNFLSGLQSLSVMYSGITEQSCAVLASALSLNQSQLKKLDIRGNKLSISIVKPLSDLLEDPYCKLQELEFMDGIETELPLEVPDKQDTHLEDPAKMRKPRKKTCVCS